MTLGEGPRPVERGVYEIPLTLSPTLSPQRTELERALLAAQRRIRDFAVQHGWADLVRESFADRAKIFDTKRVFDDAVIRVCELDPSTRLVSTACAALERRVLMSVSPQLYAQIYPKGVEDRSFEKLLAHEIAHRLHVRILGGDEDAMGPIWFFEGFAIHAAGQFEESAPKLGPEDIWSIVQSGTRGSYPRYASVFGHLLGAADLQELVSRAGREGFVDWLRQIRRR